MRVERVVVLPSTDGHMPNFIISVTNMSEPSHPGALMTKTHLQEYSGVMRGGDRRAAVVADTHKTIWARQLPLLAADDFSLSQAQGSAVTRAFINFDGIFDVVSCAALPPCAAAPRRTERAAPRPQAQAHVALSRVERRNGLFIAGSKVARVNRATDQLELDMDGLRATVKAHSRALIYWRDLGLLSLPKYAGVLAEAECRVREQVTRSAAAAAAYGQHHGAWNGQ